MNVSIQRIYNRSQSKFIKYRASWECFDSYDYLIGYVDDIGEQGSPSLVFHPLPQSMGFSESDLADMICCVELAHKEQRKEMANARTNNATRPAFDPHRTQPIQHVPEVLLDRRTDGSNATA